MIPREHERLKPKWSVEIFGEFTQDAPWQRKIPCTYDQQFECFKVDVEIRQGQKFKFIIENGK